MHTKNKPYWALKNNTIENLIRLSSAVLLLVIVLLYILLPELAISINRLMEMTLSGSEKGLMMIYYQGGDLAWAMAGLNHILQLLSMVVEKSAVLDATKLFFSPMSAQAIWILSGLIGIFTLYGIGSLIRVFLLKSQLFAPFWSRTMKALERPYFVKKIKIINLYELMGSVLTLCIAAMGQGLILGAVVIFGFLGLDYKKVLVFSFIGFLLY